MILESIRIAIQSIRMARIRSFLTMSIITIGVLLFVLVSMFLDGFRNDVQRQVDELGANIVAITPGQTLVKDIDGTITDINPTSSLGLSTLTEKDFSDLEELESVAAIAPQMIVSGLVETNNQRVNGAVTLATNGDLPEALGLTLKEGAFFKTRNGQKTAVVGQDIKEQFAGTLGIGRSITFRDEQFVVTGILEESDRIGINLGVDLDRAVFIPLEKGRAYNEGSILFSEINIKLNDNADPQRFVKEAEQLLLENHGGQRDFTVSRQEEIAEVSEDVLGTVKLVAQGVSLIVSFVALIVVMLIMYVTVSERTHEIGIRKAVGAQQSDILLQFIIEALTLSFYGSMTGVILAFFIGNLLEAFFDVQMSLGATTIFQSILLFAIVGLIGGAVPAYQAARKDPVTAIRS